MTNTDVSFRMKGILLMTGSACLAAAGQALWKLSSSGGVLLLFLGFSLYGLGALLMLTAYRFGRLSTLQPIQSINYIMGLLLGAVLFHEQITWGKGLGVAVILLAVLLLAREGDS